MSDVMEHVGAVREPVGEAVSRRLRQDVDRHARDVAERLFEVQAFGVELQPGTSQDHGIREGGHDPTVADAGSAVGQRSLGGEVAYDRHP